MAMKLKFCWIGRTKMAPIAALTRDYVERLGRYLPVETHEFKTEASFLESLARERTRPVTILLDAHGRQFGSEAFAEFLRRHQDGATATLLFAIGPADGWSPAARAAAGAILSLGPMTLPHELARVVLAEQLYRGFTILAGHPYHTGH
jgi:23S rRNA (pseudouridine1915-N3)-methyltransferase